MYCPKEYIMGTKKTQVAKEAVKAKAANKRPVGAPDFRELLTTVVHRLSIIRLCEAAIG